MHTHTLWCSPTPIQDNPSAVCILGGSYMHLDTHYVESALFITPPSSYPMQDVTHPSLDTLNSIPSSYLLHHMRHKTAFYRLLLNNTYIFQPQYLSIIYHHIIKHTLIQQLLITSHEKGNQWRRNLMLLLNSQYYIRTHMKFKYC